MISRLPVVIHLALSSSKTKFNLKASLLVCATLLVSACFSLQNLNPFNDKKDEANTNSALNEGQSAKREMLIAGKSTRPSLQSLDLQPVLFEEVPVPTLSLAQKLEQYEALMPLVNDPIQKQQVAFRLADIKMLIAEQAQQEGTDLAPIQTAYADAISDYQKVLYENSIVAPTPGLALSSEQQALNRKQMDAMYQLARALDLSAKPLQSVEAAKQFLATFTADKFDITPYHLELYFRIGEYYFNRQQYALAVNYYRQVIEFGSASSQSKTNFYAISAYMLGWSHFKLDNYSDAMQAFATMLDASLEANSHISASDLAQNGIDDLGMPKGELRLVKDSIRIMALTFSYQGDGDAIHAFFENFGHRDYEQLIFDELAQQHLDNDRFQDSANVLVAFANAYPLHPRAIEFYIRHIDAFVLGDFPERVLTAKENFVNTYSLGNGVMNNMNTPVGRLAAPYLRDYLKQLAQTEHSIAQGIDKILSARLRRASNVDTNSLEENNRGFIAKGVSQQQSLTWARASESDLTELSRQAYTKAKGYYKNFIRTFEPDPDVAPLRFYLAESHLALQEFDEAIQAFETFAYVDLLNENQSADTPKAVDAAYAALLVYQKMLQLHPEKMAGLDTRSTMQFNVPLNTRQASQAKFAELFAGDSRATNVALTLMQDLFAEENYLPAQEWANWLLNSANIGVNGQMQESAMLVIAHSNFAMQQFSQAEMGYRQLLATLPANDKRRQDLSDRLAASLYKQAENMLVAVKLDTVSLQVQNITHKNQLTPLQLSTLEEGVNLLQKVVSETPLSEFRLAAQYDSAVYFALLEYWQQAINTFVDFKQRYPEHPLSQGVNDQLFYAYEQLQDWPQVASMLMAKYRAEPKTEAGRLALFQAAEYYEKAGDRAQSLTTYRRYAHQYKTPLSDANEARYILSEFYVESGEETSRRFWLKKIVASHLDTIMYNRGSITPRATYLASSAAMVFAQDADNAYTRIKLTQPLASSLKKKQSALQKAIFEFEQVLSFGSAEFVTAANYSLANLYSTLAKDLMDSTRPQGLSDLELSQYEILLEEQAYPFEETAIDLHEKNIDRVKLGLFDRWIKDSYTALKRINPGRYNKPEAIAEVTLDDL